MSNAEKLIPVIYPYSTGSDAGKLLAKALDTKRVLEDGNYIPRWNHLVINYGNQRQPVWARRAANIKILNPWDRIRLSSNKLSALNIFKKNDVSTIQFSAEKAQAVEWIKGGGVVLCRTVLNGYGGHGIVIAKTEAEIVPAPLYCLYKKNAGEYRVVVVGGVVVDYMQKKRRLNREDEGVDAERNSMVRNHDNGWIFARDGVRPPPCVFAESIKAANALGLDFGGVDVIFNRLENKAYVLECNTALGLHPEGTTLNCLVGAFKNICNGESPTAI